MHIYCNLFQFEHFEQVHWVLSVKGGDFENIWNLVIKDRIFQNAAFLAFKSLKQFIICDDG